MILYRIFVLSCLTLIIWASFALSSQDVISIGNSVRLHINVFAKFGLFFIYLFVFLAIFIAILEVTESFLKRKTIKMKSSG